MKRLLTIIGCISLIIYLEGCKKQNIASPAYSQAYTRFIFLDAPGEAKLQFYLDGQVNANGDSSINNPNGTVFQPDNTVPTTSLVDIPSGGWTDNSPVNFSGVYGYNFAPDSAYAEFPNPTVGISLAPIINNYNYFNWASLPARQHELTLYSVLPATLYGNAINVKGAEFFDQPITLEGGAIQTYFVVNESACKLYAAAGIPTFSGLPIYSVGETINYTTDQFGLITVKDHPDKLPAFKDSSAYIRFMNLSPNFSDQTLTQNAANIDVYLAPMYGTNVTTFYTTGSGVATIDSIGPEFLVAQGLNRFQSTVDAPFYELNVATNMRNNNAGPDDSTSQTRVPRYYRVKVYPTGHSAATGDQPLAQGDWLAVFSEFGAVDYSAAIPTQLGEKVDSWLLRYDGTNYHPSICTIPIAVTDELYPNTLTTNYLSFRSCIDYIPAGINNVYFGN
jgi:hypothetical protein